jgi:CPA2 family monovalent cation:H+ antiporter-2
VEEEQLENHVVIIGYGRVGKHLVNVLESLSIPLLVIESDSKRIEILNQRGIPTLYGDAGNSEVLKHARLDTARVCVATVPEETTAILIVTAARDLNPKVPVYARAATEDGVRELKRMGANHVVHPELEGGLELVHHTLLSLGYPLQEVHRFAEAVRQDHYDFDITTTDEHRSLHDLLQAMKGIEVVWMQIADTSPLVGKSLLEANLRSRTGASVVAVIRDQRLVPNPKSGTVFEAGDRLGVIGEKEQILAVQEMANLS